MAIVGRDLDTSERKDVFTWSSFLGGQSLQPPGGAVIATGTTLTMFMVPFPCTIQSGRVFAFGVSGAPQIILEAMRFVAGSTNVVVGISNMVLTAFGTSGVQGLSGLPPAGSTLLNLLANDVIQIRTAVANTAIQNMIFELVVTKTQDIVSYNNVST